MVESLHRRRVDAIIVTSSRVGTLYRSQLDQIQVPIVLINNQEEGDYLHFVAVDDIQGAQLAVEHLITLGHRRIGYVGAPNRPKSNRRRLDGYQAALEQAGLKPDPALILCPPAGSDIERGAAVLEPFLKAGATAVFCYNDLTAISLLKACYNYGLTLPQDLSIVGFDDIEMALYVTPALTTIHQPRLRLGQGAIQMVLDLLNGEEVQDQTLAWRIGCPRVYGKQ